MCGCCESPAAGDSHALEEYLQPEYMSLTTGVSIFPFPFSATARLLSDCSAPDVSRRVSIAFAVGEPACSMAWRMESTLDRRLLFLRGSARTFLRGMLYIASVNGFALAGGIREAGFGGFQRNVMIHLVEDLTLLEETGIR